MAEINVGYLEKITLGDKAVQKIYQGSDVIYPAIVGYEPKTEYSDWTYSIAVATGTRSRNRYDYERPIYGNGTYGAWALIKTTPESQTGSRAQQAWVYTWNYNNNSTRTATIIYTFTDTTRNTSTTETGGERVLVLSNPSGTIPANGSSTVTASAQVQDYWPTKASGSLVRTVAVTGFSISVTNGFTSAVSGSTVTFGRANNTTTSAQSGTATISMSGFTSGTISVSQTAGSTTTEYSGWTTDSITLSANTGTTVATAIPARGGSATITASATQSRDVITKWNGIQTSSTKGYQTIGVTPALSPAGSWYTISGNVITAENRTINAGPQRSVTLTGTYGGKSNTIAIIQLINEIDTSKTTETHVNQCTPTSFNITQWAQTISVQTSGTKTTRYTYSSGSYQDIPTAIVPKCEIVLSQPWARASSSSGNTFNFSVDQHDSPYTTRTCQFYVYYRDRQESERIVITLVQRAASIEYIINPSARPRLYVQGGDMGMQPQVTNIAFKVTEVINGVGRDVTSQTQVYSASIGTTEARYLKHTASVWTSPSIWLENLSEFMMNYQYNYFTAEIVLSHGNSAFRSTVPILVEKTYGDFERAGYPGWENGGILG